MSGLGLATVVGFMTPILTPKDDDVVIEYQEDFLTQQIELFEKYFLKK